MSAGKLDVLLVEDNPDHAELIMKELEKSAGLINKIHLVKDGNEALDYLFGEGICRRQGSRKPPDLILLDLKLPKIDGLAVLKRIRDSREFDLIPVIVLTTSSYEEDIIKSYENGINMYIIKPVSHEKFINVLSACFSRA